MSGCLSSTVGTSDEPAPDVLLTAYGDSAIEYTVRCWASVADYWMWRNHLNEALRESFAKYGVDIPYNHLNIHILDRAESRYKLTAHCIGSARSILYKSLYQYYEYQHRKHIAEVRLELR
ncbi:MAG: hypothetical protein V8S87_00570 [Oscillospiraceae bacterium]